MKSRPRPAIEWIGALYEVERGVPRLPRDAPQEARVEALALPGRLREACSRGIVATLRDWAYATKPVTLPQSSLGKAIEYTLSLWPGLTVFLADPRVPLDNNAAERALRGVVVGRKNHYGSHAYVLETTRRAIASPHTVTLPHDVT